jgi:hypothetical protein
MLTLTLTTLGPTLFAIWLISWLSLETIFLLDEIVVPLPLSALLDSIYPPAAPLKIDITIKAAAKTATRDLREAPLRECREAVVGRTKIERCAGELETLCTGSSVFRISLSV